MKLSISIFLFNIFIAFGQKKDVYVNENLEYITKEEFNKNNFTDGYLKLKIDADSIFVNVSVKREVKGKISISLLDSIKSNLSTDKNDFTENKFIVINYYPGRDNYNSFRDSDYIKEKYRNFTRKIKRNKEVKQFFVYKEIEGTERYGNLNWIKDEKSIIEKTFFPFHYSFGSFVLIDASGYFYSYKGEYNIDEIQGLLKNRDTFVISD